MVGAVISPTIRNTVAFRTNLISKTNKNVIIKLTPSELAVTISQLSIEQASVYVTKLIKVFSYLVINNSFHNTQ